MFLKVKKLHPEAFLPVRAHKTDAALDLRAMQDAYLTPNGVTLISTGIAVAIPEGYYGQIADRSSVATQKGLHVVGGVIDAGYRGEIKVAFRHFSSNPVGVMAGDKIAQLIILPVSLMGVEEVDDLDETDRGQGGFGSTGQ